MPSAWGVVQDGSEDGVVVLDPQPGQPAAEAVVVRSNIVIRHFPAEDGLAAVAVCEAAAATGVEPRAVTLAYDHGTTDAGLPFRRHHVVLPFKGHMVHSVRWFVAAGSEVLELALTFEDDHIMDELTTPCERIARGTASASGAPVVPVTAKVEVERDSAVIPPLAGDERGDLEALDEVFSDGPAAPTAGVAWHELDVGRQAFLERNRPVLVAEGLRGDRFVRLEAYREQMDLVLAVTRARVDEDPEAAVTEYVVTGSLEIPFEMLCHAGLRAGWTREVAASAPIDSTVWSGDVSWDVEAGGERALPLLSGLRDPWLISDLSGGTVAEWCSSDRAALFAVFRDDDAERVRLTGIDGWTIYVRLLASWVAGAAV
ncbi:hypothetical protein MUG60_10715 [Kaistella montana]|nr:hypothetical protein [Kaistella montana]